MNLRKELDKLSEDMYFDMLKFCKNLIKVPALSGEEKEVADLYIAEMKKLKYDEVFRDEWGNVIGIINGEIGGPTIMYNSHLDHVDVGDLSEWDGYDPYGAKVDIDHMLNQDGNFTEHVEVIHGRAASDVKGGGAVQIYAGAMLIKLRNQGHKFKGKFMFTGVVLEEPAEQLGMKMLIDETLPKRKLEYDAVVSSEATSLKLYLGHRGRVEILVKVHGQTSHGSAPWLGINSVNQSTKLIDKIEEKIKIESKEDQNLGKSSIALTIINCTPGSLCIVPDRTYITYDRRFVPGETADSCVKQIQEVIDKLALEDHKFKADVEISAVERTSYTGKKAKLQNIKQAWKIDRNHGFVKLAAKALENIGEEVKYGYWDFGTDLSIVSGRDKKPSIGYSPMQEFYCHRPIDKIRTDYMKRALAGNVAIFLEVIKLNKSEFKL